MALEIFINGIGIISPCHSTLDQYAPLVIPISENNILTCIEPIYKEYINPTALRRMSRMIKMGISSAKIALDNASIEIPDAIITATGLGCLEDTEKFIRAIDENGEEMLTPTPFIQSTHNTVGGQIALQLKCHAYNFTYVHRGTSFEAALIDAAMLLSDKPDQSILVGGIDELTSTSHQILQDLGLYKTSEVNPENECIAGEGASFFVLSNTKKEKSKAKISFIKTISGKTEATTLYNKIVTSLTEIGKTEADIDLVLVGTSGNENTDTVMNECIQTKFKNKKTKAFKPYCGEFPSASGFALGFAINELQQADSTIHSILICNHFYGEDYGLMLVERC